MTFELIYAECQLCWRASGKGWNKDQCTHPQQLGVCKHALLETCGQEVDMILHELINRPLDLSSLDGVLSALCRFQPRHEGQPVGFNDFVCGKVE